MTNANPADLCRSHYDPVSDSFYSPGSSKSSKSDELTQRIRTICLNILENHTRWLAAQRRGSTLCGIIEAIKKPSLELQTTTNSLMERSLYPNELKSPCAKLKTICTIFEDVVDAASEAIRQLSAIVRLSNTTSSTPQTTPVKLGLKTWSIHRIILAANAMLDAYKQEFELKLKVMENIAHSKAIEELVMHACVWQFPCFVNDGVQVIVASMSHECGVDASMKSK